MTLRISHLRTLLNDLWFRASPQRSSRNGADSNGYIANRHYGGLILSGLLNEYCIG
jgi:hypothetical protein